jgi:hypothetical protein
MPCCLQVSRLQVAELVTAAVLNPELAENKCLEVVAETTAPNMALEALLEQANTEITKVGLPAGSGRHSPVVWCECGGRGGGGGLFRERDCGRGENRTSSLIQTQV